MAPSPTSASRKNQMKAGCRRRRDHSRSDADDDLRRGRCYKQEKVPPAVFAGKEYGTGSSRDWAAKGTVLLASVPSSRSPSSASTAPISSAWACCHWSLKKGPHAVTGLKGDEKVTIRGVAGELKPRQKLTAEIVMADGGVKRVPLICRIDTLDELEYFRNGGILQYVLRQLAA